MEKHYIYKIINIATGIVEYVGRTKDLETRWKSHTRKKPGYGMGKFYQRTNVAMVPISRHSSKEEAKQQEKFWQRHYDCEDGTGFKTRKLTIKQAEEIRAKYIPYEYSISMLAKEYGVGRNTIRNILINQTYTIA